MNTVKHTKKIRVEHLMIFRDASLRRLNRTGTTEQEGK